MHPSRTPWPAVVVVLLAAAAGLSACSSQPEIVPSSGPRSATSPDQVKLYQEPPKKYERLGVVTVASGEEGTRWDERGDATVGFDILKRKAAALGANGLLLAHEDPAADAKANDGEKDYGDSGRWRVLAGYKGDFYEVPVMENPRRGLGQAIYVHKEK